MSEPDDLRQPQAGETRAGASPAIIHLPDQSQPEPMPSPPRQGPRRSGKMKGRHFGPRPVTDPLSARFNVRCRPEFLARLTAAAEASGLSLSAFVCEQLGELPGPRAHRAKPDRDRVLLAQMMAALGRSGNNLNQLLRRVNSYDFRGHPELLKMAAAMTEAHAAHHKLVAAIKAELGV
jgi:hypothetical protein